MTNLCPYELGIIDTVRQVLLSSIETAEGSRLIRAELYNINIYSGPSGMFKPHVDTPRSSLQIGSLVVCLPTEHKGGELAVRQNGRSHTFDWGANSEKPLIQWAAFYSDCEHEVFEVKSGHRRSQHKDRIIGFYSTHAYPHTVGEKHRNLPLCLKGIDMAVYETFRSLGAKVHLCSVVEHKDTGDGRTASDIETDGGKFSDGQADSAPSKKAAKAKKTRRRRSNNAPGHSLGQLSSRSRGADWESEEAESSEGDSEAEEERHIPSAKKHVKDIAPIQLSEVLDEDMELDDMIEEYLGNDTVDPKQIVWINQNNGLKELQIAYLTYGNEASMDEVYSHFAMVIEIPAGSIAA
ncbi:oxidoreductase [Colletotrichum plurivorum]|uniref:Oxidoreductase n=1 Tax=Colletotrichum plurivorum TaxID=2175906 RepID=A0A8H6K7G3_9PEZI|nr:oxidoreductase [Colletotrichum plurivorum]